MVSELQTGARMWAAIEGTLTNDPHRRNVTTWTMRAKLLATDAKGNDVRVRLVIRRGRPFADMADLRHGDRVRVIGKLALAEARAADEYGAHLWLDVDSAVRLEGAERTKHSRIERLIQRIKFWSTK